MFLFLFVLQVSEIVIMEVGGRVFDFGRKKVKKQMLTCDDM